MLRILPVALVAALAIGSPQAAQQRPSLVIRHVTVVDGAAAPRPGAAIVVDKGRITAIVNDASAPEADLAVDASGLYAIPGLIDAHVHVSGAPFDQEAATLGRALRGGVTSVWDLAGDTRETSDLARAALAREIDSPSIYYVALMAGPRFFSDPRVVGAALGFTPGTAPWGQAITASTDAHEAIALARGTGATGIKLYAALDSNDVHRLTAEAHRQHLRVVAHATTFPAKPGEIVDAGVDMLAHAPYLVWEGSAPSTQFEERARGDFAHVPPDGPAMTSLLESMKAHGTALNPTLWIFTDELPREAVTDARIAWMDAVTRRANTMGIPIVAGTDGLVGDRGGLPNIHRELELLVNGAGLTPAQALDSATRVAAHVMGVDVDRGSLVPGRAADILLLRANPQQDIRNTRQIRYVIKDGRVIDRQGESR